MRGPIGRRLLSLTLLLCLLAGCSPAGEDPAGSPASSQSAAADAQTAEALPFALAYDPQDSLHPYEAEGTLNLQLMNLLYDGLVRLDSEFYPEPRIADWIEVDGRTVTIALRSDVVFSDGSPSPPTMCSIRCGAPGRQARPMPSGCRASPRWRPTSSAGSS